MTLEEIYFVSQTISSVAVVASLIYLAQQTRQASRNQLAQMHLGRTNQQLSDFFGIGGNADIAAISIRGTTVDPTMSDAEILQFIHWLFARLALMEEHFRLHKDRMIADERWRSTEVGLRTTLGSPGTRAACRLFQQLASKEFSAVLDRVMTEARSSPQISMTDAWKVIAAEESESSQPSIP